MPVKTARRDFIIEGRALVEPAQLRRLPHHRGQRRRLPEAGGGTDARAADAHARRARGCSTTGSMRSCASPITIRPWLDVRMPTFGLDDQNLNGVISYFGAVSNTHGGVPEPRHRSGPSPPRTTPSARSCSICSSASSVTSLARFRRTSRRPTWRPTCGWLPIGCRRTGSSTGCESGDHPAGHPHAVLLAGSSEVVLHAAGRRRRGPDAGDSRLHADIQRRSDPDDRFEDGELTRTGRPGRAGRSGREGLLPAPYPPYPTRPTRPTRPPDPPASASPVIIVRMLRPHRGRFPRVHPSVFIDDSAQVIGDVEIGEESSVWMSVVVRGDVHRIRLAGGPTCRTARSST